MDVSGDSVTLLAVSPLAVRAGVCAGMTATAARSLLPGLTLIQANPAGEEADFESLAAALGRFSPRLCTDPPRALLLEISGCVRLFGSESALAAQAAAGIERQGYSVQLGLADNPTAAMTLALAGRGTLDDAPVAALRLEPADLSHLQALGVRTVGALRQLPLEGLPARFSGVMLARLRQIRGDAQETFAAFAPPQQIEERLEFEGPTDRHDALLFALRRLAVGLQERLAALEAGALGLQVNLRATDGSALTFPVTLTRPTRESRSLTSLLHGRFESVDRGERWFDGVSVQVTSFALLKAPQRNLFEPGSAAAERSLAELVDELAGKLGPEAVVRAEITADPRPERSFTFQAFGQATSGPQEPRAAETPVARPATLFEPHEVTVDCDQSGRPRRWQDGRRQSGLVAEPVERIHFGWWVGDGAQRDYFAVQDDDGARWWLMHRQGRWYIVGAF